MTEKPDMMGNKIIERLYVKGDLQLVAPLIVGSGEDEWADIQLIRDWAGHPFLPGTSIAGALRHYVEESSDEATHKLLEQLFGQKPRQRGKKRDTTQSLCIFYDACFTVQQPKVTLRDGVKLDWATKTAINQAKYDYEILEPGQCLNFKLEVAFRQRDAVVKDRMKCLLFDLIKSLQDEKIAIGAKTRRGFGVVRLEKAHKLELTMPRDVQTWLDFHWEHPKFEPVQAFPDEQQIITPPASTEIVARFAIPYSILIRHYNDNPQDVETTHLTSNDNPIIPGTSWNGALRHAIWQLLHDLGYADVVAENLMEEVFGYVHENADNSNARASRVTISESVITDGQPLTYTRNKVDRFTGGVVEGALFDEQPHYGGTVELRLVVKEMKEKPPTPTSEPNVTAAQRPPKTRYWEIGLLLLALKDLGNGIQPIGGDANIGRGILQWASEEQTQQPALTVNTRKVTPTLERAYWRRLVNRLQQGRT